MPEVERHPRQSIGGLSGVALFLSLLLRFQSQLHQGGELAREPRRGAHASTLFPKVGNCFFKQIRRSIAPGLKTQTSAARVHSFGLWSPRSVAGAVAHEARAVRPLAGGAALSKAAGP